ncbi:asparaginase-domain-containing protein [Chytriomyces cf. hyalinus JEL632]|nr:asparaginase-domain-containing protein [Chytriomyces cf. hyalinus JEL632]
MFSQAKKKFSISISRTGSQTHSRTHSASELSSPSNQQPVSPPVFMNEFVTQQIVEAQDELVRSSDVSRVLILYTGGTIGMKNHHIQGYTPAKGFLTETLKGMRRFNDPFAALVPEAYSRDSSASAFSSPSWAETSDSAVQYQPVNLPLQYNYPSTDGEKEVERPPTRRMSSSSDPVIVINGTPVIRSRLPILVTPRTMYGKRIKYSILEYDPLMDSSNMTMKDWVKIATDIEVNYHLFDAFMVIHGTDTMAYTASALSFMLEDLGKTVVVTGSQVPMSEVRNDAVENLLGALTIAGHFVIPEVTLFFAQKLFRGNRSSKVDAYSFSAFDSPNMRPLVDVSINIDVSWADVLKPTAIAKFKAEKRLNPSVAALRLFPGITIATVKAFLSPPIAGVVLESFGSGNAPNNRPEILAAFKEACDRGVVIVNCSQCLRGLVTDLYATGKALAAIGIVPGSDMTPECALTKLSYLLGKGLPAEECRELMRSNLRGELTVKSKQMRFTHSYKTQTLMETMMPLLSVGAVTANAAVNAGLSALRVTSPADADLETTGNSGVDKVLIPTVLCHAARNGDVETINDVAKQYGPLVSIGDYDGRTPLHIAASENHYNAVEALLLHGASVHQRDRYGHSPLYDAVRNNHVNIARLLRDAGAHFSEEEQREVTNLGSKASYTGKLDVVQLLCECGADMNIPGLDGRTAVHMAVSGMQLQILTFFIEHSRRVLGTMADSAATDASEASVVPTGIEIKLDLKDRYGRTPLDDAIALNWQNGIACIENGLNILK